MSVSGAQERITKTVISWEGMNSGPHRFGGVEYRLGSREIGHIHNDSLVDIPFPKSVRDELVMAGKAQAHHILPETGWVSFYLHQEGDIKQALILLRKSYDIARRQRPATNGIDKSNKSDE